MAAGFTPVILAHTVAAVAAVGIGALVFARRKGGTAHRSLGYVWVALMALTALSSFWIRASGSFSWIHGLSVTTLVVLAAAIVYAVRRNLARHQRLMRSLYFGGLASAGFFTLLPQRLLGQLLWNSVGLA